jgi:hypothetical protein
MSIFSHFCLKKLMDAVLSVFVATRKIAIYLGRIRYALLFFGMLNSAPAPCLSLFSYIQKTRRQSAMRK